MIHKEIAIAILVSGYLLAQRQPGTTAMPMKGGGTPGGIIVSGGAASAKTPMPALVHDAPASTQVLLPGCEASHIPGRSSNRDYSTPSSRLVGRWASQSPLAAAALCRYYGPIDKQTGTGVSVTYLLEVVDEKTGEVSPLLPDARKPPRTTSWKRTETRYQIINEVPNGDLLTLRILDASRQPALQVRTETHDIPCSGMSDASNKLIGEIDRYVDCGFRRCRSLIPK